MNAGERVKIIRKESKLTQKEFGDRIGTTKNNISMIESGKNNLTEVMAKAICREFDVDYFWLTEGTGEMFIEKADETKEIIDKIVEQYQLNETSRSILEAYVNMNVDQREAINGFVDTIVKSIKEKEKTEE